MTDWWALAVSGCWSAVGCVRSGEVQPTQRPTIWQRTVFPMADYILRYGSLRLLGSFTARDTDHFVRNQQVLAKTSRGVELAEVLCEASDRASQDLQQENGGRILRLFSETDRDQLNQLHKTERQIWEFCQEQIKKLNLEMRLIDVEQVFGGERILVYYLAENRVDFRELVKILAAEFGTRIEMRQIGVRDEAKLLADYGDCGKPVCCNTHLSEMPPVSMKMAKLQKATLDPSKISGRCGRLKCCLRYEYDTYQEIKQELPPIGSAIVTDTGRGKVLGHEILAGQLLVQTEDMRRIMISSEEVLSVLSSP
ncbi:MAG: regulatory iron-sulfur-containing complex subunit RicT [Pirellulales bacterium]|nr:regulatory iron-sulfur-containing complex subunit RicT [Pirellulales bacterium]